MAPVLMHASCVAVSDRGLLIIGPSGSGKSGLALDLMALGAVLVADDQTELSLQSDKVIARSPASLAGMIEARGVGILTAPYQAGVAISLVVDLALAESDRLPPFRKTKLLGLSVDLVLGQGNPHLPSSLLRYLQNSRQA
jgi:HPr kinase/phosphorylase